LKWVAAIPASALVARTLVACDAAEGTRGEHDADTTEAEVSDTADTSWAELAPDTIESDTTASDTQEDIVPSDATDSDSSEPAEVSAPDSADTAPDSDTTPRTCAPTAADAQGPYYLAGAPTIVDLAGTTPGKAIAISGFITDVDCAPIANAKLEVWQADADGDYHDDRLRATITANAAGAYAFTSIMPGRYLQATGLRPAHLHFKVSAPGFRTVVTQIYFAGDPYLQPNDSCATCASDDPARILDLTSVAGRDTSRMDVTLRR